MKLTALLSVAEKLKSLGGVVLAIIILLAMVTIHEFGHYVAGKALGFQINEFAVGFGPAILKKRSKKTGEVFSLRIIPLGGFCAFEGEEEELSNAPDKPVEEPFSDFGKPEPSIEVTKTEEEVKPQGARFNDQKPWKRIVVLVAGATMNYLLALVLIMVMFFSYGCVHSYVNIYKGTSVSAPAFHEEVIGYQDIVTSLNGKDICMATDYAPALSGKKQGESVEVKLLRRDENKVWQEKIFTLILQSDANFENMTDTTAALRALGLDPEIYAFSGATVKRGFGETLRSTFVYSFKIGGTVLRSLGELITGKIPLTSMGGPITTIGVTAQAASASALSFLNIAAFIGVNLAVFNLLPVPALDGCKVIFCLIEWIRKKPINRKIETIIHFIGSLVLFGFAILVDVLQFL